MKTNDYLAIFFDMGSTLEYTEPTFTERYNQILGEMGFGYDKEKVREGIKKAWATQGVKLASFPKGLPGEDFWFDFYRTMIEGIVNDGDGVMETTEEFGRRNREYNPPLKRYCPSEVYTVLEHFKKSGFIMGIVSNWDDSLVEICESYDLPKYFDFILASQVVGSEKPDPGIFNLALKNAGVEPEEAIHVGDLYYTDVVGARGVGITPVLLDPEDIYPEADCTKVKNILDLINLFEG